MNLVMNLVMNKDAHIVGLWAWVLALALGAAPARAQLDAISVETELSRSRVYVGDELSYQVIIRGARDPEAPDIEFPDTVRAQFHGRSSQSFTTMRNNNGSYQQVTERRYSFQYTLTALEEGTVTIPAPVVSVDGKTYRGDPASFDALFPVRSDLDDMELTIERDEIYLNETVVVECSWWIGDQTSQFSLSSSMIPDTFELRGVEPPSSSNSQQYAFELQGERMLGVVDTGIHNGQQMSRFVFRFSVTPTQAGAFDLGPIRAVFTRRSGTGSTYRSYVESNPIVISVLEVPTQGQPQGYTGAIGEYRLSAKASNRSVNVGDPITLTLTINAREPMIGVEDAPHIEHDPEFIDRFKIASEGWREVMPRQSGRRVYETTIRALSDEVTRIPPIRLPSFNPVSGSYKVYQTSPIELSVSPVQEVTLQDAIVSGGVGRSGPAETPEIERIELTRAMPGLWAHGSAGEMLDKRGFRLDDALTTPVWIATLASGPTLLALSLLVTGVRRARDPEASALQRAYRRARNLSHKGEPGQALRQYVSAALKLDAGAITAADARDLPIDADLLIQTERALAQTERTGYDDQMHTPSQTAPSIADELLRSVHIQVMRNRDTRREGTLS